MAEVRGKEHANDAPKVMTLGVNIVISSLTGSLNMIITNPLDTYRLRWQVQPVEQRSVSTWQFLRAISQQEGLVHGLWRPAIATNAVMCAITVGTRLGVYPSIRDRLNLATGTSKDNPTAVFGAGLLSGGCAYFIASPLYMIKNQLQSQASRLPCAVAAAAAVGPAYG